MLKQERLVELTHNLQNVKEICIGMESVELVWAENLLDRSLFLIEEMKDEQKREIGQNLF